MFNTTVAYIPPTKATYMQFSADECEWSAIKEQSNRPKLKKTAKCHLMLVRHLA
jgi:hypothetical protein